MSILDCLPDQCTISRRVRSHDSLGGKSDSYTAEKTAVACWSQPVSANEVQTYQQRGLNVTRKVYFIADPQVTPNHVIQVTKRSGTLISSPGILDVVDIATEDASIGLSVVWRVMANNSTAADR